MRIIIDPGHGGDDNGAEYGNGKDYLQEDDLNLAIAFYLDYELRMFGHEVKLTRSKDIAVALSNRVAMANLWGADLFLSIHADAFHKETASGFSAHVFPESSQTIARSINRAMAFRFPEHRNRGVRESNFYVLRKTQMPSVLIESEFVSNPETRRFLREPENQKEIAICIRNGVHNHLMEPGE